MNRYGIVFPGQGSQSVNMLQSFAHEPLIVQHYCQRASEVLGYDIASLIETDAEAKLNKTEYTQPALLLAGVIAWEIWKKHALPQPAFLSGHSLGEYTALACAECISFEDAIKLVRARGQYMQEAVPEGVGAMAAIVGLSNEAVDELCRSVGGAEVIAPANFNSDGQVVIAGTRVLIEAAVAKAKEKGAKLAVLLPMSVPSHCQLMLPAAERLREMLARISFQTPSLPVINNVDVKIETSPDLIKKALVKQLYSPVRWVEVIQLMVAQGATTIIECGPGKVLTGLVKRIDKTVNVFSITEQDKLKTLIT